MSSTLPLTGHSSSNEASALDALALRYPKIPPQVRLKAALLFYGLRDDPETVRALVEAGDLMLVLPDTK